MSEFSGKLTPAFGVSSLEGQLHSLDLIGAGVASARLTDGLQHFELGLDDGRTLRFEDCLQVSYNRPPSPGPVALTAWWIDEPSPLLQSLPPEIRFGFQHVVFELGDCLLRIAYRRLLLAET